MNKEENKQHANDLGIKLIMNGKYTAELEREWNSILNIVPEDYFCIWQLNYYNKKKEEDDNK